MDVFFAVGVDIESAFGLDDGRFLPFELDALGFGGGFLVVFIFREADAAFDLLSLLFGGGFYFLGIFLFRGSRFGTLDGGDGGVAGVECGRGDDVVGFQETFVAFGTMMRGE